jgi:hypothetical protein
MIETEDTNELDIKIRFISNEKLLGQLWSPFLFTAAGLPPKPRT